MQPCAQCFNGNLLDVGDGMVCVSAQFFTLSKLGKSSFPRCFGTLIWSYRGHLRFPAGRAPFRPGPLRALRPGCFQGAHSGTTQAHTAKHRTLRVQGALPLQKCCGIFYPFSSKEARHTSVAASFDTLAVKLVPVPNAFWPEGSELFKPNGKINSCHWSIYKPNCRKVHNAQKQPENV